MFLVLQEVSQDHSPYALPLQLSLLRTYHVRVGCRTPLPRGHPVSQRLCRWSGCPPAELALFNPNSHLHLPPMEPNPRTGQTLQTRSSALQCKKPCTSAQRKGSPAQENKVFPQKARRKQSFLLISVCKFTGPEIRALKLGWPFRDVPHQKLLWD